MVEHFDPYYVWLGIPPGDQPPNHYRLLGVSLFEQNAEVIEQAADQRMGHLRNHQTGTHERLSQKLLNEVANARVCLLNAEKKTAYDQQLRQQLNAKQPAVMPVQPTVSVVPRSEVILHRHRRRSTFSPSSRQMLVVAGVAVFLVVGLTIWGKQASRDKSAPGTRGGLQFEAAGNDASTQTIAATKPPSGESSQGGQESNAPLLAIAPFDEQEAKGHQLRWAKYLKVPVEWENSIGMKFVLIPPGIFMMGAPDSLASAQDDEKPQHRVQISRPFYLGTYEVTQVQYMNVVGNNPSGFQNEEADTTDYPIETVYWSNTQRFCAMLSSLHAEKRADRLYRLPTEAEWEYACRAGTKTVFGFGENADEASIYGWHGRKSKRASHPVGQKKPNVWGLYDMHGNVWEWCADWYGPDYYRHSPQQDPVGPEVGTSRVTRGGCWWLLARASRRGSYSIRQANTNLGFRVALSLYGDSQDLKVIVGTPSEHKERPQVTVPAEQPAPSQALDDNALDNQLNQAPNARTTARESAETATKPIPTLSERQEIRRAIDGIYDTERARKPEEALELANMLVALAEKCKDAKERFVLLYRASELASDGGDARRMLRLMARIAEEFEVDRLPSQAAMLKAFAQKATGEEQIGALVAASANIIDEALDAERIDLADALSASVYRACMADAGRAFRPVALARRREVQELRDEWEKVEVAREVLKSNPNDESAHTALARWYSLHGNRWDQALPHYAKGANPELKKLADQELNSPPEDPVTQIALADAWWELAKSCEGEAKDALMLRAAYWYERVRPRVSSALDSTKIAKRLGEVRSSESERRSQTQRTMPSTPDIFGFNLLGLFAFQAGSAVDLDNLHIVDRDSGEAVYQNDFDEGALNGLVLVFRNDLNAGWRTDMSKTRPVDWVWTPWKRRMGLRGRGFLRPTNSQECRHRVHGAEASRTGAFHVPNLPR